MEVIHLEITDLNAFAKEVGGGSVRLMPANVSDQNISLKTLLSAKQKLRAAGVSRVGIAGISAHSSSEDIVDTVTVDAEGQMNVVPVDSGGHRAAGPIDVTNELPAFAKEVGAAPVRLLGEQLFNKPPTLAKLLAAKEKLKMVGLSQVGIVGISAE